MDLRSRSTTSAEGNGGPCAERQSPREPCTWGARGRVPCPGLSTAAPGHRGRSGQCWPQTQASVRAPGHLRGRRPCSGQHRRPFVPSRVGIRTRVAAEDTRMGGVHNSQGHSQGTKRPPANLCPRRGQASCRGRSCLSTVPPLRFGRMAWPTPGRFGDDSWGPGMWRLLGWEGPRPPGKRGPEFSASNYPVTSARDWGWEAVFMGHRVELLSLDGP